MRNNNLFLSSLEALHKTAVLLAFHQIRTGGGREWHGRAAHNQKQIKLPVKISKSTHAGSPLFPKEPIKNLPLLCVVLVKYDQVAWNSLAFRPRRQNVDTGRPSKHCINSRSVFPHPVYSMQLPLVLLISWEIFTWRKIWNILATQIPLHVPKHLLLISTGNIQVHWNTALYFPRWQKLLFISLHLLGFFLSVADWGVHM